MSPGKELLLSCIVMMHISFMASRPVELNNLPENLQKKLHKIILPCQDLWSAEDNYTRLQFSGQPPSGLNTLVQGITMENTTKEISTSICAISNYLRNHMGKIINTTVWGPMREEILSDIKKFTHEFKGAVGVYATMQCNTTSPHKGDNFKNMVLGCQILSSVRRWVEHFAHNSCVVH